MGTYRGRGVVAVAVACAVAFAAAGAKTKLVDSVRHAGPETGPAKKILVLAVATDPQVRSSFEDVIAGELSLRGVAAKASHVDLRELPKDRAILEAKVTEGGFDAVLVSRLVGVTDKVEWKKGGTSFDADYIGMSFYGGYTFVMEQVAVPGYLEKETRVRLQSDLWRTSDKGGWLQWTGFSETIDPMNLTRGSKQVGAAVAKSLAKEKLI